MSPWSSASSSSSASGAYHSLPFVGHTGTHDLSGGTMQPMHMNTAPRPSSSSSFYDTSSSYRSMPLMWDSAGQADGSGNSSMLGLNSASSGQHPGWSMGHDASASTMSLSGFPPSLMTSLPPSSTTSSGMPSSQYHDDEAKWQAVLKGSHHADRHFLYASSSAQTYCRPSCPASAVKVRQHHQYHNGVQRSRSDMIRFFSQPDAAAKAEATGYKSCRRCRPDLNGGIGGSAGAGHALGGGVGGGTSLSSIDGLGLGGMVRNGHMGAASSSSAVPGSGEPQTQHRTVIAVRECVREMMLVATNSIKECDGEPKKRTLKDYAAKAGLSTFHFHRELTRVQRGRKKGPRNADHPAHLSPPPQAHSPSSCL